MFRRTLIFVALVVFAFACARTETGTDMTSTQTTATEPPPRPAEIAEGLQTPESVLYDADQDVYFISNINGQPLEDDDNGFISRVNAETLQSEVKWIDGSKAEVTLNAPKGMAIVGDELWVADHTYIAKFDRRSGAPKGRFAVGGTVFLNDLAADGNTAYVTDTGMKAGAKGFEPTGSDAVWALTPPNKSKRYAKGNDLKNPNGLAMSGGKLWVVTFGSNELFPIESGKKGKVTTLPKGGLDGLVAISDGSFLVSSWEGKAVYRGKPGETFTAVVENVDSPADIGYDTKRHRLLVPHFTENKVSFHEVQ